MSATNEPQYLLLWKGIQSGPFTLALIREKLGACEISRMHQVNSNGRWIVLDEFLEKQGGDSDARRRAEAEQRETQLRRTFEDQLATERAQRTALEGRITEAEERSRLSHLLPPQVTSRPPPLPASQQQYMPPQGEPFQTSPASAPPRTSGLAVAALVTALCSFIPYVGFVTWILAIVFGHVALSQMKRDPALLGRGMAIAGVSIAYALVAIGFIVGILIASTNHRF